MLKIHFGKNIFPKWIFSCDNCFSCLFVLIFLFLGCDLSELNSSFSTLHLLVIKELRFERNVHQGVISQVAGKSPSAWNKIESGQSALTVDAFFGACNALQMSPSGVLNIVERLVPMFNAYKVFFHTATLDTSEDGLLPLVLSYFNSKGFEALRVNPFGGRTSVLNLTNPFSVPAIPTVVSYCTDEKFREWIDGGAGVLSVNEHQHHIGAAA